MHAMAAVVHRIREMLANGGMAEINRALKAARAATPACATATIWMRSTQDG